MTQTRFIVVTGGVLSGLGKGITASSIGTLLKARGLNVTAVKIDPYVNCDAGTMNPFEHGEVFVLEDGGEVDLDLGNYERFLRMNLTRDNNITTGKVYGTVIAKERKGRYLGKTVQIVPHITNEIRDEIEAVVAKSGADVCLIEVGGTVGDIESMPFLEAVRQLHRAHGHQNVVFVHTTLVPVMGVVGEPKTKPTQHSVKELKSAGIEPDMIVCRCATPVDEKTRQKISLFCDVEPEAVISAHDARTKYEVPLILHEQGVDAWLVKRLDLPAGEPDLDDWRKFLAGVLEPSHEVNIGLVGKYTHLADSYMSILEGFVHAGAELSTRVHVHWVDSEKIERGDLTDLDGLDGIVVAPGFGARGTEGKVRAVEFARTRKVPFLGICFGFQLATVEYARSMLGFRDATSTELVEELGLKTTHPVIDLLPEQHEIDKKGGTMRLGATPVKISKGTRAYELYGTDLILERHRHRYEVNPQFRGELVKAGLVYSGRDSTGLRMEILELPGHPFFVGSQFHPEFKSRPGAPAPLFRGLVEAALKHKAA